MSRPKFAGIYAFLINLVQILDMFKITRQIRTAAAVLLLGMGLAACSSHTPNFQGSPPLSAVPDKIKTFTTPYTSQIGVGAYGAAILLGPNLLPGRCEGMYMTGDRALVCEQLARFNGPPEAKPDPNARYRCTRTLGGVTECVELTPAAMPTTLQTDPAVTPAP